MADENNAGSIGDEVKTDAPAPTPAPKKQRAARRPKAIGEATAATLVTKSTRGRRKRSEQAEDVNVALAEIQVAGKGAAKVKRAGRNIGTKPAAQAVGVHIAAIDEMSDLIRLEEENKRLRKTLAEKLRAENADLRKRLGLD